MSAKRARSPRRCDRGTMTASGRTEVVLARVTGRCFVFDVLGWSALVECVEAVDARDDEIDIVSSFPWLLVSSMSFSDISSCSNFVSSSMPRSGTFSCFNIPEGDLAFSSSAIIARCKNDKKERKPSNATSRSSQGYVNRQLALISACTCSFPYAS